MKTDGTRLKQLPLPAVVSFLSTAIFIEVASILQSIRQDSWGPIYTTRWLPVVVFASYRPLRKKGCRPLLRRRTES
jgi:hypothetical protein